ncbi:hypothetical protein GGI19_006568 [Coemansia pectinata]|uniref:Uncharacterized protein n=1 Tax=Coemansia pectinata TaxID=1052879 RepID=A0A9W8L8H5_9FUNG|nr:hypothetical protein GGI19_006568 [Coemansia pectinata]
MYKAFIRPTMEYALEICIPNASLVKVLERCQGDMLRAMLGVPKPASYAAILLLCKMETMEHRWCAKLSSYIRRRQLDSDDKHILSCLFNMERVAQMKSSRLIPRLCQEAYCAGPPHLITTTISEKKRACMHALKSANKSATRVAQIKSLGFICSMFQRLQHANAIDAVLMALNKNDVASAIQIALVIDKIYTQCLGRRSLIKQLTPRALE